MSTLLLSYCLLATNVVAMWAALGASRRLRTALLIALLGITSGVAAISGSEPLGALPGSGQPIDPLWFPLLAAAILAAVGGTQRYVPVICVILTSLAFLLVHQAADIESGGVTAALALHDSMVTALAGLAIAAFAHLSMRWPNRNTERAASEAATEQDRWRFADRLACVLVTLLLLALTALFAFQENPLQLDLSLALLVMPAEAVAAVCVWRAAHAVFSAGQHGDSDSRVGTLSGIRAAQATAILTLFAVSGISLAWLPVILSRAAWLRQ